MSTLEERINEAYNDMQPRISKTAIWKACGISSGAVSLWFNGTTKTIDGKNARIVADLLGVNRDWLAEGKGPKHGPTPKQSLELPVIARKIGELASELSQKQQVELLHYLEVAKAIRDHKSVIDHLPQEEIRAAG
jgi:hypothetical protein